MTTLEKAARRALKLRQWAMRASDKINQVEPARCPHVGDTCDYANEFIGHRCRCGEKPMTWDAVYTHVLWLMEREGIE